MHKLQTSIFFLLFILIQSSSVYAGVDIVLHNPPLILNQLDTYNLNFTVKKIPPSTDIFSFKTRIGSNSATLNQAETFNPLTQKWLTDTASWTEFPSITLDTNGMATASVTLRPKLTSSIGLNQILIRLNKNSINYDSSTSAFIIFEASPTPSPFITPTDIPISLIPTISPTTTPGVAKSYIANIYISEVFIYPTSGDKEWIEIYNENNSDITLSNWYIDDVENAGASPKLFSIIMPAKGYAVIDLSSSIFNNDSDSVRLLNPDKQEVDSLEYVSAKKSYSLGRLSFEDDIFCIQVASKNIDNTSCINNSPTPTTVITSILNRNLTVTPDITLKPTIKVIPGKILSAEEEHDVEIMEPIIYPNKSPEEPTSIYIASYIKGLSLSSILITLITISLVFRRILLKFKNTGYN